MVSATYKILLEQTSDGQSSATVLEIPDCQAIAITPQEAISQVQARLTDRLATAQIVSIQIPSPPTHNHWIEFSGIFQDDPDFAEIAKAIRAERTSTDSAQLQQLLTNRPEIPLWSPAEQQARNQVALQKLQEIIDRDQHQPCTPETQQRFEEFQQLVDEQRPVGQKLFSE